MNVRQKFHFLAGRMIDVQNSKPNHLIQNFSMIGYMYSYETCMNHGYLKHMFT